MRARAIAAAALALCLLLSNTSGVAQVTGDADNYTVGVLEGTAEIVHGDEVTFVATNWDDGRTPITLPFAYTFYGKTYEADSVIWANANGILEFEENTANPFSVTDLPNGELHHAIFAYWEDLRTDVGPDPTVLGVRTSVSGVAPHRTLNIEWRAVHFRNISLETNFAIRLYEGESRFDVVYADPGDGGTFTTVGVQRTETNFTTYPARPAGLSPGLGLRFDMRRPTTLSADTAAGTYRGTTSLTARLLDADGPVEGATVHFDIDGVLVGTAVSDGNGNATLTGVSLEGRAAGRYDDVVRARFAGTPTHLPSDAHGSLVVDPAMPVVTWAPPTAIVYGTPLSAEQLNAVADVAGTFEYAPKLGQVLDVDTHDIAVTFKPEDSTNYNAVTVQNSLVVSPAELSITADSKSRLLGAANPAFTGTITGIRNGDSIAVRYSTTATTTSPVGTYVIEARIEDPQARLSNYNVTVTNGDLTVSYKVCALYDQTRAHKRGRTVPIKLQLCNATGSNVSKYGTVLNALAVTLIATQITGAPEDAGDANPDGNFRYTWFDSGPGYIFNLKTTEFEQAGIYRLTFSVSGDSATHSVQFQLR